MDLFQNLVILHMQENTDLNVVCIVSASTCNLYFAFSLALSAACSKSDPGTVVLHLLYAAVMLEVINAPTCTSSSTNVDHHRVIALTTVTNSST